MKIYTNSPCAVVDIAAGSNNHSIGDTDNPPDNYVEYSDNNFHTAADDADNTNHGCTHP